MKHLSRLNPIVQNVAKQNHHLCVAIIHSRVPHAGSSTHAQPRNRDIHNPVSRSGPRALARRSECLCGGAAAGRETATAPSSAMIQALLPIPTPVVPAVTVTHVGHLDVDVQRGQARLVFVTVFTQESFLSGALPPLIKVAAAAGRVAAWRRGYGCPPHGRRARQSQVRGGIAAAGIFLWFPLFPLGPLGALQNALPFTVGVELQLVPFGWGGVVGEELVGWLGWRC